jgi:anaerobic ribonucleoside-triphosphate reductase activating protein
MDTLRVVEIVEGTSVDGPGLRTSIYFAGCKHQCPGCHNKQTWDFEAGRDMSIDELMKVIDYNGFNVTFSGGDPLYQADKLTELARRIKASGKTIWCYTGFTYEEVCNKAPFKDLLAYVDVLVDGPFIEAQRNIELRFRGSENQRIIDLNNTQPEKITILR